MSLQKRTLLCERFKVLEVLGKGSYGEVFSACDVKNDNIVAIKVEKSWTSSSLLARESRIYNRLWSKSYPIGILRPISFFNFDSHDALALPLLGRSLRDLWKKNGCFSLKSICMIGIQLLNRLEHIHRNSLLHMDLKPDNMMIGRGKDCKTVYLIDLGLAKIYKDRLGLHLPYKENVGFRGTRTFASIYTDDKVENSPRDDIESMMYSLVMLHRGMLPWCDGDWCEEKSYPKDIKGVKRNAREMLFFGMPSELQRAWDIICQMDFGDTPRYDKLRELFLQAAQTSSESDGMSFGME